MANLQGIDPKYSESISDFHIDNLTKYCEVGTPRICISIDRGISLLVCNLQKIMSIFHSDFSVSSATDEKFMVIDPAVEEMGG